VPYKAMTDSYEHYVYTVTMGGTDDRYMSASVTINVLPIMGEVWIDKEMEG